MLPAKTTAYRDLTATKGSVFSAQWTLYEDPRVTEESRNRGTWSRWRVYASADIASHGGIPYIATLRNRHIEPGTPEAVPFWSPVTPRNLEGATATFVVTGVFSVEPRMHPLEGTIKIVAAPFIFAEAPDSAPYALKMVDDEGVPTLIGAGTMLFS